MCLPPLLSEQIGVESDELFELDVLDSEVVNQEGEDSLKRSAWLSVEHDMVELTASDSIVFHPADMLQYCWVEILRTMPRERG